MNAQPELEAPAAAGAAPDEDDGFPWLNELRARNAWIIGDQLVAPRRGRAGPRRGGRAGGRGGGGGMGADGPLVETRGAVGGFDLIEADSLDEAVEIASNHPV